MLLCLKWLPSASMVGEACADANSQPTALMQTHTKKERKKDRRKKERKKERQTCMV